MHTNFRTSLTVSAERRNAPEIGIGMASHPQTDLGNLALSLNGVFRSKNTAYLLDYSGPACLLLDLFLGILCFLICD